MSSGKARALVADDHELFRIALATMLKRDLGFGEVIEAETVDAGVEKLRHEPRVSLATFDLIMPGMNDTTLSGLRESFPGLRVVVVTSSLRREDILRALSAGVHGYIPKTMRIGDIAAALRSVLDGHLFVPSVLADGVEASQVLPPSLPQPAPDNTGQKGLTARQQEVLRLLAQGRSNKEIARGLNLSEGTVKAHVNSLFRALGVHNRIGAAAALARMDKTSGV
jgi:DNA-binding NarL/FixJ family response regulator